MGNAKHSMISASPRLRGERELPANVSHHHRGGYIVRVRRRFINYQAFTKDLGEAVRLRDKFLAQGGQVFRHKTYTITKPRSNTGHVGIVEMIKWVKYRPRYCFSITWQREWVRRRKVIFYGPRCRSRDMALRQAVAFRRKVLQEQTERAEKKSPAQTWEAAHV